METKEKSPKFTDSLIFKGLVIAVITLLLLIPQSWITNLTRERKGRSEETIEKINEKWSSAQTLTGPVLSIPYLIEEKNEESTTLPDGTKSKREVIRKKRHVLNLTPEQLNIQAELSPEEKYYGIYKAILYRSNISLSGTFKPLNLTNKEGTEVKWEEAYITLGLSDLKGVAGEVDFTLNKEALPAKADGSSNGYSFKQLILPISQLQPSTNGEELSFHCNLKLNGSGSLNFVPLGKTTQVEMSGAWNTPNFVGSFSPESNIGDEHFSAKWCVLHFNRDIPEHWIDNNISGLGESSFGVNLIEPVNRYQQAERTTKYAFMFIALTFVAFFLIEVLTGRRIHPIQYLLVGIALILFYSLLLSISEQISFGLAYLIASSATVGLISAYAQSIFKDRKQTGILAFLLSVLYLFFYVILQQEDFALLIGSIGLFIILAAVMAISRKINFYK